MSTSRSRLTRSIQEIAKRDPDLRRAIEATKPRGDQPSAAGVGTSDAERDRVCCDGSVSDETNPGTETRDPDSGGQDGLNPDDSADIGGMGAGSLTGLHDCATGEPVCFEGSGWIPPDGWDSPSSPPPDPTYEEGYYWGSGQYSYADPDTFAATPGKSASLLPSYVCVVLGERVAPDLYALEPCEEDGSTIYSVKRLTCNSASGDYCNPAPEDIAADSWPSDSCISLAIKGGSIVGSKYDPENDGTYSKPMSEIELCDGFGNSFYLRPSAGGGWKTINATKDAGYLWGSSGQKIAHINGNEYGDPSI